MNSYKLGQVVVCEFTFEARDGSVVDPNAATLSIVDPDGVQADHPLTDATREGQGVYTLQVTGSKVGRWKYEGNGDNGAQVAAAYFRVVPL
jgi:hypothetical protein